MTDPDPIVVEPAPGEITCPPPCDMTWITDEFGSAAYAAHMPTCAGSAAVEAAHAAVVEPVTSKVWTDPASGRSFFKNPDTGRTEWIY